jgi:cell division protein FtsB
MNGWKQRALRQLIFFALISGLIVYVAADAIRGPHGLAANQLLSSRVAAMKKELAALKAQRARLERDAELLGPKSASQPALLDEQARAVLDLARPSDIVIVNSEKGAR